MTDVFICVTAPTEIRYGFAISTIARWKQIPNMHLHILFPEDRQWYETGFRHWLGLKYHQCGTLATFQRERRVYADRMAGSDPYILADDDCIPIDLPPVALLSAHPTFAILSMWPTNATIYPWQPSDKGLYTPVLNDEIMEHVSVGGIRVCRKGALPSWPPQVGPGYDADHCFAIRRENLRVGLARKHRMVHLGEHFSTVWPMHMVE